MLPLSQDLIFIKFDDESESKRGYVFYYPSQEKTYLIESSNTEKAQVTDLDNFETLMCQMLYVMHNQVDYTKADNE